MAISTMAWLGLARVLLAKGDGSGFELPQDVVMVWGKRACLIFTLLGVLLVTAVLTLRRHRLMEAQTKWLLFLGICVIPVPTAFLNSGIGMEESKSVAFCQSCHAAMGPFVSDMTTLESRTLAAAHYKYRYIQREHCWNCHSNYGIAGTVEAKLTGLKHIGMYTTNSWRAPIAMYGKYDWRICLGCHAESVRFRTPRNDAAAHKGVVQGIQDGSVACTDCHQMAHPPRRKRGTK